MKIDLLEIATHARTIYCTSRNNVTLYDVNTTVGICSAIRWSIIDYERKYLPDTRCSYISCIEDHMKQKIHKPPKHYYPLKARHIEPYCYEYWWKLDDVESRLKRFDEYIEYFKKPENRYLEV